MVYMVNELFVSYASYTVAISDATVINESSLFSDVPHPMHRRVYTRCGLHWLHWFQLNQTRSLTPAWPVADAQPGRDLLLTERLSAKMLLKRGKTYGPTTPAYLRAMHIIIPVRLSVQHATGGELVLVYTATSQSRMWRSVWLLSLYKALLPYKLYMKTTKA